MSGFESPASYAAAALVVFAMVISSCNAYPTEPSGDATEAAAGPAFSLPAAQGGTVSLADFRSKKDVLLYFSMGPG